MINIEKQVWNNISMRIDCFFDGLYKRDAKFSGIENEKNHDFRE